MPTQIKFRGGTYTEHQSFTGAEREITVDTTNNTVVVHDGVTLGGFPLALADLSNATGGVPSEATATSGATTPESCSTEGALFFNTTDNKMYVCQSSAYVEVEAEGTGGVGITSGSATPESCTTIGELFYNTTEEKLYACNGSTYETSVPDVAAVVTYGSSTPLSCSTTGALFYNTAEEVLYTCDGSNYVSATNVTTATGTSTPASCSVEGGFFFNTTEQKLYICDSGSYVLAVPTSAQIEEGSITASAFASSISPVEIFATNPTVDNYEGRMVYNTTDDKLYRYDGTDFVATIDTADLTGTISAAQIAANAVTADKIEANAVTAGKIAAGAISATEIATDAITSDKILAGSVIADKIATNAITAGKISAGAVDATKIATNAVTADKIAAGEVTAAKIQAGAIDATKIAANAITADKITTGAITSSKIASDAITADKIAAGAVTADTLSGGTITATTAFKFQGSRGYTQIYDGVSGNLLNVYRTSSTSIPPVYIYDQAVSSAPMQWIASSYQGLYLSTRGSSTSSSGLAVYESASNAGGVELAGFYGQSYDQGVVKVTNRSTSGSAHGLRVATGNGSSPYASGLMCTGGTSGYAFYSERGGFYDAGGDGYNPFTGVHEALIARSYTAEVGDILVDVEVKAKNGVSDTITLVDSSSSANQKAVIGVLAKVREDNTDHILASCKGTKELQVENQRDNPEDEITYSTIEVPAPSEESIQLLTEYRLIDINALGEGQINVCGEGGDIEAGDLIVTSSTAGKGMKQADDIIRGYTVAKAREAVTFSDPSEVKQIACIYMCG